MRSDTAYRAAEQQYWDTFGVSPREEWHDLPRTGCRVRVQVVGDGPPVVFLHGVNTGGTVWAPLAARLPQFRCLLVDRPGCGLSDPLPGRIEDVASFATLAEGFTAELLDVAGIRRAPLVATSLGGYHALRSAAARPDRVSGVVQMGWTVGAPNDRVPLVMRLGGSRRLGRLMASMPAPKAAIRPMLARIGLRQAVQAGRVSDEMVTWFHALLARTPTMRHELDGSPPIITFRGLNDSILLPDAVLSRIDVPVTFIWGEGDPFGDVHVARSFAARVPGSTLVAVPDAGHAVWMDDLELVAGATADALSASLG
ncbi:MAG TPA: alpha/beta hydrolase [Acidimicrobiales bacterium]|nr:alpha/beta hydrolase [Acidimicrobiales bacterium]